MAPSFLFNQTFFDVLGVFFSSICGVFSGLNMSGQLREPRKNVPLGTITALITVTILYVTFVLLIASVVTRSSLQTNYNIASEVSAWPPLFLTGIYVSALSAALGGITGSPRLFQSIAESTNLFFLRIFKPTFGDSKVPVAALFCLGLISILCVLFGNVNLLGPFVTIPFLATYTCLSYSYFCLAMTYDQKLKRDRAYEQATSKMSNTREYTDLDKLFPEERKFTSDISRKSKKKERRTSSVSSEKVSLLQKDEEKVTKTITQMPNSWYSFMVNRWSSLFGVIYGLVLMFLIHWAYSLLVCSLIMMIYLLAGMGKQALALGVASDLNLIKSLCNSINTFCLHFTRRSVSSLSQTASIG
ncbi:hypothetical protein Ciccas_012517 [Cichlidogyrus casuarinus]|uniref:Amino acid permease/ SLC12A domain-containing protein n=1 Tax=Cichlidogyrus casuarinus TaxID=1844966 RepID=A0ABD2PNM9_9PLAT